MKNILPLIICCLTLPALKAVEFTQQELSYMSAKQLISLFKTGELKPSQVLEAQIKQITDHNEAVNCITFKHFDQARAAAAESDARYAAGNPRPLEGITVAIKDEHFDKGWKVTQGSLVHMDDPAKDHADPIVTKLKEAGALCHIQTTVPELYLNYVTSTRAWGTSRNPWNLKYAVGGSSGGSGAALAAGFSTLATGSDMGGSVRIPCAFNGLYGYKPAFGQYHTDLPMSHFSGTGPMARSSADLIMMHNAISGPGKHSINVYYQEKVPQNFQDLRGLKIAYVGGIGILDPSKSTEAALQKAIATLQSAGATVETVALSLGKNPEEISTVFSNMALAGAMGGLFAEYADKKDQLTTYGTYFVEKAAKGDYGNSQLYIAEQTAIEFYTRISDQIFSKGYDIMILPTLPTSHIKADHDFTKDKTIDENREFPKLEGGMYTLPFNLLNWCPVISVPAGITEQNMPVGMQIVGKPSDTNLVFRVAAEYDKHAEKLYSGKNFPNFQ